MHLLVIVAAILIATCFYNSVAKFAMWFAIGIIAFVMFAIIVMAIPVDHKSKSTSLFALDQTSVTSFQEPSDVDRAEMAKLLRYGQRRLANQSQEKGE